MFSGLKGSTKSKLGFKNNDSHTKNDWPNYSKFWKSWIRTHHHASKSSPSHTWYLQANPFGKGYYLVSRISFPRSFCYLDCLKAQTGPVHLSLVIVLHRYCYIGRTSGIVFRQISQTIFRNYTDKFWELGTRIGSISSGQSQCVKMGNSTCRRPSPSLSKTSFWKESTRQPLANLGYAFTVS